MILIYNIRTDNHSVTCEKEVKNKTKHVFVLNFAPVQCKVYFLSSLVSSNVIKTVFGIKYNSCN